MTKALLSLLVLIALVTMGGIISPSAFAGGRKSKSTPTPAPNETVISNVGPTSITVNEGGKMRTFTITKSTEVTLNSQRAGMADLKPGMKATVSLGTDPTKASRIVASGK